MAGAEANKSGRDLTIHQMRCFGCIVEAGSVSRAAARLGISQSAMSRMLAQIESTLGARLFDRSHHGLHLTNAGTTLRDASLKLLHDLDVMRDEINALSGNLQGHCRVAMPESVGRVLFLPLVQTMGQHYSKCTLRVMAAFSASMPELLLSGQLDVAVVTDTHSHAGLETERLGSENFVLIGRRGDDRLAAGTISARRLAALPLILTAWSGGIRAPIDEVMAGLQTNLDVRLEIDCNQAILDLVRAGEGYSVLPFSAVHREAEDGSITIAKISRPSISRTLFLATPANRPVSPAARKVLEMIKLLAKEHEGSGGWRV